MANVSLEGLSKEQIELVERFVELVRRAKTGDALRADLRSFWERYSAKLPPLWTRVPLAKPPDCTSSAPPETIVPPW